MTVTAEAPPRTRSVVLVEDHLLLAESVASGLRHAGIAADIATLEPFDDLAARITAEPPDLVLLDLELGPARSATALLSALTAAGIPTLLVTGTPDHRRIAAALECGAVDWFPKTAGLTALVDATTDLLVHGRPTDPARRRGLLLGLAKAHDEQQQRGALFERLTDRERDTLHELREGHSVGEIARRWVVSEATVRTHVRGVLVKLRVGSQLAAVAAARRAGWEPAPSSFDR